MPVQKLRFLLFLILSGSLLSGCGSSDGGTSLPPSPADVVPPTIDGIRSYPEGDTERFEVDDEIRIVFSELVDIDSVLDGGIQLFVGKNDETDTDTSEADLTEVGISISDDDFNILPGEGTDLISGETIEVDVHEVIVRPEGNRFALDTVYTAIVNTTVSDQADDPDTPDVDEANYLTAENVISFTTQPGLWQTTTETVPVTEIGNVYDPVSASNLQGDVIVAWLQVDSASINSATRVMASRFVPDGPLTEDPWENVAQDGVVDIVDSVENSSALDLQIGMNEQGMTVATWVQADSGQVDKSVWINNLNHSCGAADTSNVGWDASAFNVSDPDPSDNLINSGDSNGPQITIDQAGNILLVWREQESGFYRIKSRYCDVESGWGAIQTLFNLEDGDADAPVLTSRPDGNAVVVWGQEVNPGTQSQVRLYASVYQPGNGWRTAERIDSSDLGSVLQPTVAINGRNDVVVLWPQLEENVSSIWQAHFISGVWQEAELFEFDGLGNANNVVVAVSPQDSFHTIWSQELSSSSSATMYAREFIPGKGWQDREQFSSGVNADIVMKFDNVGNGNVLWRSRNAMITRRYVRTVGWQDIDWQNSFPNLGVLKSTLANIKGDGRVLAAWPYYDGTGYKLGFNVLTDLPDEF